MAIPRIAIFVLSLLLLPASHIHGLEVTPNSPCKSKCTTGNATTTENSIVCIDSDYTSTSTGSQFQQCVECELGSKAADPITGTTDVMWGLYNLRYTLSACLYGFPAQVVSLSSPCQVTCASLSVAIESGLNNTATTADLSFCNTANFSTTTIQNCVFCYGLTDEQRYLANFLQALNVACQDPPTVTNPFPVAASSIFNSSTIQPPTTSAPSTPGSQRLHGTSLALAISLPIVFGFFLLVFTCIACFFSARRRRREMASSGKMRRVHETWGDSPATPRATHFDWDQAAMDMQEMAGARSSQRYSYAPQYHYRDDVGPGTGQIRDHSLHDQYFPPSPKTDGPFGDDKKGAGLEIRVDEQHMQDVKHEPPNLLHSPVETHVPYDISVARGQPITGDHKDNKHNWI